MDTGPDAAGEIRRYVYRDIAVDRLSAESLASTDGGATWRRFWSGACVRIAD